LGVVEDAKVVLDGAGKNSPGPPLGATTDVEVDEEASVGPTPSELEEAS
jgi:hypothetical protein